jgi:predicted kinase
LPFDLKLRYHERKMTKKQHLTDSGRAAKPMLYICAGLPGTGKTTLSLALARRLRAVHLRIDIIEQALRESGLPVHGPEGYVIAYRLAEHNLGLGLPVVTDSVNPIGITRAAWRETAHRAGAAFVEIEFITSDPVEHRRRVETRLADIAGFRLPTWEEVVSREYEPWEGDHVVIDTAGQTAAQSEAALLRALGLD